MLVSEVNFQRVHFFCFTSRFPMQCVQETLLSALQRLLCKLRTCFLTQKQSALFFPLQFIQSNSAPLPAYVFSALRVHQALVKLNTHAHTHTQQCPRSRISEKRGLMNLFQRAAQMIPMFRNDQWKNFQIIFSFLETLEDMGQKWNQFRYGSTLVRITVQFPLKLEDTEHWL